MSDKDKKATSPEAGDVANKEIVVPTISIDEATIDVAVKEALAPTVNVAEVTGDVQKKEVPAQDVFVREAVLDESNPTFELECELYTFTEDCPAKLQIDGKVYELKDLVTNQDVLTQLVVGESGFVKKA
jgi:hypothetical protein